jgi:hypothetical protein
LVVASTLDAVRTPSRALGVLDRHDVIVDRAGLAIADATHRLLGQDRLAHAAVCGVVAAAVRVVAVAVVGVLATAGMPRARLKGWTTGHGTGA